MTPPLEDIILPGVTRDSVLKLAEGHTSSQNKIQGLPSDMTVSIRPITMKEVKAAASAGQLLEMFGTGKYFHHVSDDRLNALPGTAAIISPVKNVGYMGEDIPVPVDQKGAGPIAHVMLREIVGRQVGTIKSDWSVPV